MKFVRLLLLTANLGLAACAGPQKPQPEDCLNRTTEEETDGGLGGTGNAECIDPALE